MIKIIPGDACVTLVIDRPERRNALTNAMYTDLDLALQSAPSEAGCNAIILTGSGGHFTAGNDLSEFQAERAAGDSPAPIGRATCRERGCAVVEILVGGG